MRIEVELLFLDGSLNTNSVNNILLRPVFDADKSKSQLHIFAFNHSLGVGTLVHDIDFSDDTDSSNTFWVQLSCHLKSIGGSHISIGWENAKNNSSWVTNVSLGHSSCDLLNIVWLVRSSHWNSGNTRQINQCEIWACVRIDLQHDWFIYNIFTLSTNLISQEINSLLDLLEVLELLVGNLLEFRPWFHVVLHVIQSQL